MVVTYWQKDILIKLILHLYNLYKLLKPRNVGPICSTTVLTFFGAKEFAGNYKQFPYVLCKFGQSYSVWNVLKSKYVIKKNIEIKH